MSMQKYSQEVLTNKVFEFVFGCAMHDAILQQSFKGKKDWVGKVTEAQSPLREYMDKIFKNEFKTQSDHDRYGTARTHVCARRLRRRYHR